MTDALCIATQAMNPFEATIVRIAPVGLWFFHIRSAARIDRVVTAALTPIIAAGFDAAAFIIGLASVPPRLIAFVVEYASNACRSADPT